MSKWWNSINRSIHMYVRIQNKFLKYHLPRQAIEELFLDCFKLVSGILVNVLVGVCFSFKLPHDHLFIWRPWGYEHEQWDAFSLNFCSLIKIVLNYLVKKLYIILNLIYFNNLTSKKKSGPLYGTNFHHYRIHFWQRII